MKLPYISSDEDGSDTERDDSNLNNLIDALPDEGSDEVIEKVVEHLRPAEKTSSDTGLKRTLLEDEDRFENVFKWFTGDDRSTINNGAALAILTAPMVAPSTVKALLTEQIGKDACVKELGAMKENETFSLVRLPAGKRAVSC